jgi:putative ABC transport system permease protein
MIRRLLPLVVALSVLAVPCAAAQAPTLQIAVERRLADAAHLSIGDTLRVSLPAPCPRRPCAGERPPLLARVAAIMNPRADPSTIMRREYRVRLHLADLASLLGEPDRVDRFGIVLAPGIDPDSAATRLNRAAFGYDVFTSRAIASESSTTFAVVSRFHRAIAIISVLASAVFLLCLMLLKVDERRADVAVLRFTGISRRTVFLSLVLEATMIALAGSVVGAGLAFAASAAVNWYYQRAFETTLIFSLITPGVVLFSLALSLALGFGAGALAAWRLVRVSPIELWRRPG